MSNAKITIHSQAREILYRVYTFMKEEKEATQVTIPLSRLIERVSQATGVATVKRIVKEDRIQPDGGNFSSQGKPRIKAVRDLRWISMKKKLCAQLFIDLQIFIKKDQRYRLIISLFEDYSSLFIVLLGSILMSNEKITIHSQAREILYRVYTFMKEEKEATQVTIPLSRLIERVSQATGSNNCSFT
ncbi:hypothetical protein FQA39_LY17595 [Lamprigera yunnana]|nr:hypothetical protein FQA39_LY17595 [Lamprigera yunnana]